MYNPQITKAPDSLWRQSDNCCLYAPKAMRPSSLARTSNIYQQSSRFSTNPFTCSQSSNQGKNSPIRSNCQFFLNNQSLRISNWQANGDVSPLKTAQTRKQSALVVQTDYLISTDYNSIKYQGQLQYKEPFEVCDTIEELECVIQAEEEFQNIFSKQSNYSSAYSQEQQFEMRASRNVRFQSLTSNNQGLHFKQNKQLNLSPKQDSSLFSKIEIERPANPHSKNFFSSNKSSEFSLNNTDGKYPYSAQKSPNHDAIDYFDNSTTISSSNKSDKCYGKGDGNQHSDQKICCSLSDLLSAEEVVCEQDKITKEGFIIIEKTTSLIQNPFGSIEGF